MSWFIACPTGVDIFILLFWLDSAGKGPVIQLNSVSEMYSIFSQVTPEMSTIGPCILRKPDPETVILVPPPDPPLVGVTSVISGVSLASYLRFLNVAL